jgi:hypothetical protein
MNQLGLYYIYTWKYYKETSCVSSFISNKQKFHIFLFSSTKLENRSCPSGGWHQWEGGGSGKGYRRVNTVKKCVYMYVNVKMIPTETFPGKGEGEIAESTGGGEFKYDIFNTF